MIQTSQEQPCTTVEEHDCVKRVQEKINFEDCMTECDGLVVTSYDVNEIPQTKSGMHTHLKYFNENM